MGATVRIGNYISYSSSSRKIESLHIILLSSFLREHERHRDRRRRIVENLNYILKYSCSGNNKVSSYNKTVYILKET